MKHALTIVFLVIFSGCSLAQGRFKLTIGTGLGQYKMDDLKEIQDTQENYLEGYDLERIENFPMYLYYSGEASVRIQKIISVGLLYRLQSTGCKSAYSDYSGVFKIEQIVKANNAGVLVDVHLWNKNKFSLSGQTRIYYGWTDLKYKEYLEIYALVSGLHNSTAELKSESVMINPDLTFSYELTKHFFANLSVGYCIDFKGDITNRGQTVRNFEGEVLQTDWSGFRLGLSACYKF
ncbi:MAG TPA: hypothetical protein VK589_00520 [Chryseolinea sp.]|nr:hypothetical protein [Chryseolinea sp.]